MGHISIKQVLNLNQTLNLKSDIDGTFLNYFIIGKNSNPIRLESDDSQLNILNSNDSFADVQLNDLTVNNLYVNGSAFLDFNLDNINTNTVTISEQLLINNSNSNNQISGNLNIDGNLTLNDININTIIDNTKDDNQILTNKIIISTTNNVAANSLKTPTGVVDVTTTTPQPRQILTAIDNNTAVWSTPQNYNIFSITPLSLTTTTYNTNVNGGLTVTPEAGIYYVNWSLNVDITTTNQSCFIAMFLDENIVAHTERINSIGGNQTLGIRNDIACSNIVTVNGSQIIAVRFRMSGGAATIGNRNLTMVRIG
jgi:hypothetical protein